MSLIVSLISIWVTKILAEQFSRVIHVNKHVCVNITYYKSNTKDVTCGAGITYLSGSPVCIHPSPVYSRFVLLDLL